MLLRLFDHFLSRKYVRLVQKLIHGVIDPVKMPFRIRARIRIAYRLFHQTQLLFCRNLYGLRVISAFIKQIQRFFCDCRRDRLCRKIKYFIRKLFTDCLDRRKQSRDRLSGSGRRLDKQIFLTQNGPVDAFRQFLLPCPPGQRKRHLFDRLLSDHTPFILKLRPFFIFPHQGQKPLLQLLKRIP